MNTRILIMLIGCALIGTPIVAHTARANYIEPWTPPGQCEGPAIPTRFALGTAGHNCAPCPTGTMSQTWIFQSFSHGSVVAETACRCSLSDPLPALPSCEDGDCAHKPQLTWYISISTCPPQYRARATGWRFTLASGGGDSGCDDDEPILIPPTPPSVALVALHARAPAKRPTPPARKPRKRVPAVVVEGTCRSYEGWLGACQWGAAARR